jgi:hypothetical protein
MSLSRLFCLLIGTLILSACHKPKPHKHHKADRHAVSSAGKSNQAINDADARAARLAEEASRLDAEAGKATGARRQALEKEARDDLSDAAAVARQGRADAETIAAKAEKKIQDSSRR